MKKHELYRDNLTIRDHFAGRSLQAILVSLLNARGTAQLKSREAREALARGAYEMADAMLVAREEE